jgi:hypothetical protein
MKFLFDSRKRRLDVNASFHGFLYGLGVMSLIMLPLIPQDYGVPLAIFTVFCVVWGKKEYTRMPLMSEPTVTIIIDEEMDRYQPTKVPWRSLEDLRKRIQKEIT